MPGTNWVPRVTSPIDRTHPARAYGRFNAIGSEGRTGREFHVRLEYSGRGGYRQSEQAIRVLGTSNSLQTPLKPCIWLEHIAARTSFAFETTLRHDFALSVAREAKAVGFTTHLYFVALDSVERHVQRVTARARAGGPQRARVVAARHLHAQYRALTTGPSHFQLCDGGRQYP